MPTKKNQDNTNNTHSFQADVQQLIQLVTHSIYSNKEVFLRELISNANDAIQKAKLLAASNPQYLGEDHELAITIDTDTEKNILIISDNGIGMTKEEVQDNIGTIAKSGTKAFLEALKNNKKENESLQSDLIGQFGIGFYSAFMVAQNITLETKTANGTGVLRSSDGKGEYTITSSDKTARGTQISIQLNDDAKDFASASKIKSLIKQHSNYIPVPIRMIEEDTEKKTKERKQINDMQAIWTKNKKDVSKEQYKEFYQSKSFDFKDPLDTIHVHTEGALSYKALLYIPQEKNQFAAMQGGDNAKDYGPDLYVQNVLIMEKCKDLLPIRLRFLVGVVETNDISLNVSREILQNSPLMTKLQHSLIKETLKSLQRQKNKHFDNYLTFHANYGRILKEGIHYDSENKEKIAEISLFYSLLQDKWISLDDYISANGDKQQNEKKYIYFLPGTSIQELKNSPYIEQFRTHNIDVLLMTDPIDEYVVQALRSFKERDMKSASDKDIVLGDPKEQEKKSKELEKKSHDYKDIFAYIITTVGDDKVGEIILSDRMETNISMIVTQDGQASAQMQKIMKAMGQNMPGQKKTLALNPHHRIFSQLVDGYNADKTSQRLKDLTIYIYEQAIMLEGGEIEDLSGFVRRINNLL